MNPLTFPSESQLRAAKVLIIDDERAYTQALEWTLRKAEFLHLQSVNDSARALEEFERFQPDVVLLDINMPEPDGFAILSQLRESVPAGEFLPVLVLTGDNTSETRSRALAAGASDFLGKPIDCAEVTRRIGHLLQIRFLHDKTREMQAQLDAFSAAKGTQAQT